MPLVSVIVPVRNGEQFLRTALSSITGQTLTDLEVLVVDDGSTDASAAIIDEFASADPRVGRLPGPATGSAGDARNTGLDAASGDYLAFLDADDRFAPTLLEELSTAAVADDAEVVVTGFRVADERTGDNHRVEWGLRLKHFPPQTPVSAADLGDHLFLATNPAPWNKLFLTDYVRRNGYRFQSLRRVNDLLFTYAALAGSGRISHVPGHGIDYRTGHPASLQATMDESPLDFVAALTALRDHLAGTRRWPQLERSFTNLVVETSLVALRKAGSPAAFEVVHHALRTDVFDALGVTGRPAAYFLRRGFAEQVAAITTGDTAALLFERWKAAETAAEAARAEARLALLSPAPPAVTSPEVHRIRPADRPGPAVDVPDVSVVMPVYNTEHFVREAVGSALRQSGVTLEVICVDDGSTDASATLLDRLAADPRVSVVRQAHAGLSAARNAGLGLARGRYVCFLDSDDRWRLDELSELVRYADSEALDMLLFDAVTTSEDGVRDAVRRRLATYYQRRDAYREPVTGAQLMANLKSDDAYRASACLYLVRRGLLEDPPRPSPGSPAVALRFRPGISHEDNLFTFAALLAAGRAAHLPVRLYDRRLRPGSIMATGSAVVAARGYFVCAVEMLRLLHGRELPADVATRVGAVAYRVLEQAREQASKLSPDLLDSLAGLDQGADAQALHQLLVRDRREAGARRPAAPSGPTTRLARLVRRGRRALGVRLRRLAGKE